MNKKTDFFGNSGDELFAVPVSFAQKGTLFRFDVEVAAYSREAAAELASGIPDTPVGKVYFSKDRFANADRQTIVSILKSIDGVSNVSSDCTGEADFDFCVAENEDDAIREDGDCTKKVDADENNYLDTFANQGKNPYHVPMKYGTELDGGQEIMVYFEIEIAADNEFEAAERADSISWEEFTEGMHIDSSTEDRLIGSFEELCGVVIGTVNVTECHVYDYDYETLQVDDGAEGGIHLAEDDESDKEDEEEFEDEEDCEEICEDDFGNEGEKFWWVPMEFAMETFVDNEVGEGEAKKFTFHLKIAADNEEDAVKRAGEVALQDITGDSDDDECFFSMTEDDIVFDLNTQHDSTCDADWEDSDRTFYLRVNEDEDVEECFI